MSLLKVTQDVVGAIDEHGGILGVEILKLNSEYCKTNGCSGSRSNQLVGSCVWRGAVLPLLLKSNLAIITSSSKNWLNICFFNSIEWERDKCSNSRDKICTARLWRRGVRDICHICGEYIFLYCIRARWRCYSQGGSCVILEYVGLIAGGLNKTAI